MSQRDTNNRENSNPPSKASKGADRAAPDSPDHERDSQVERIPEIGGPKGPEPTRYGDWEVKGRCSDF
ncbi:hypothetical protein J2T60_000625 [Natronospira proteinivora]|uniref:DUF1674 domain-containing protein n=1 Tax=Natronospira proteinivora TaxID=1807133 RepID=A0ABT1G5T8_9GAMM|nr:succinate dehydrogenase assembly factor 4 [Natronospira proteinivora]MCP1726660.1 hypothetical protein [Natronospira proteinivora]